MGQIIYYLWKNRNSERKSWKYHNGNTICVKREITTTISTIGTISILIFLMILIKQLFHIVGSSCMALVMFISIQIVFS